MRTRARARLGNGTTVITLPASMQDFKTVVDGTAMEEASESYNLTYTVIQNGTVTSTKTVLGTMSQDTLQSANVTIQNGILTAGATTVTTITTTTMSSTSSTSSTTPTTQQTTGTSATSSSSSTSSASSGIPEFPAQLGLALLVAIVTVTSYAFARRGLRIDKQAPD